MKLARQFCNAAHFSSRGSRQECDRNASQSPKLHHSVLSNKSLSTGTSEVGEWRKSWYCNLSRRRQRKRVRACLTALSTEQRPTSPAMLAVAAMVYLMLNLRRNCTL